MRILRWLVIAALLLAIGIHLVTTGVSRLLWPERIIPRVAGIAMNPPLAFPAGARLVGVGLVRNPGEASTEVTYIARTSRSLQGALDYYRRKYGHCLEREVSDSATPATHLLITRGLPGHPRVCVVMYQRRGGAFPGWDSTTICVSASIPESRLPVGSPLDIPLEAR